MKESNGVPGPAEFGKLRSYLARAGFSESQIKAWIGSSPGGRTRAEITAALRAALRVFPVQK